MCILIQLNCKHSACESQPINSSAQGTHILNLTIELPSPHLLGWKKLNQLSEYFFLSPEVSQSSRELIQFELQYNYENILLLFSGPVNWYAKA